ncbi:MAG TPA: carbohydrate porin [Bdellovibrionota bacterium]|nr:carbohydrate porin [Bdellovibrionota bacterium]
MQKNSALVNLIVLSTAFVFMTLLPISAQAESSVSRPAIRETQEEPPIAQSPEEPETRLTKNWGGARTRLSEKGVDLALISKWELNSVLSGGTNSGTVNLGNIDLRVSLDMAKLANWNGASFFFYGLGNYGGDPTRNIGDGQGTSNIETPANTAKLYEAWFQQIVFDEKASFLIGLHDLNSEFYVTDSSTLFFNSSFGVGRELSQTGLNGPSIFPTTAPAIRVRTEPSKSAYFQAAIFNAVSGDPSNPYGTHIRIKASDGVLLINEMAYLRGTESSPKELPGKYALGLWTYTEPNPEETFVNHGAYLLADQNISENLSVFLRYGVADSRLNRFSSNLGLGTVYAGLIPGRPHDRFGIAWSRVNLAGEYRDEQTAAETPTKAAEDTLEANYRFEAIPGLAIQPDFQYVIAPSGDPLIPNASIAAVRLELSF